MGSEVIVIGWEILTVNGGMRHGVADFVYGIVKRDINGKLSEGDYVFSTPLIEFDGKSFMACTFDTLYKLEGAGAHYTVSADDALIIKSSGISYKALQELKSRGLEPKEWYL